MHMNQTPLTSPDLCTDLQLVLDTIDSVVIGKARETRLALACLLKGM